MQTLQALVSRYGTRISYDELLKTYEWKRFRTTVVKPRCELCGAVETPKEYRRMPDFSMIWVPSPEDQREMDLLIATMGDAFVGYKSKQHILVPEFPDEIAASRYVTLHVHHVLYKLWLQPWEYSESELQTLCNSCHESIHRTQDIPVFRKSSDGTVEQVKPTWCARCNGTGYLPKYWFHDSGICYDCRGYGFHETS